MLMQGGQHDCGPASLHNALAALGHHRSLDELRALCGATASDGTSDRQMVRAAEKLRESCGLKPWVIKTPRRDVASGLLFLAISRGRPAIVSVDWTAKEDGASHWAAVIGVLGERVLVADSAAAEMVLALDGEGFMGRWDCSGGRSGVRDAFYAVVL